MSEYINKIGEEKVEWGKQAHLHNPSKAKGILHKLRLRTILPSDIGDQEEIFTRYPDLAGDRNIGVSDFDGRCQSYNDDPDWPCGFLREHGVE